MAKKNDVKWGRSRIITAVKILAMLLVLSFILSWITSLFIGGSMSGNTALIKVEGMIVPSGGGVLGSDLAVSEDIRELLKEADEDPSVKAIVLEINSPGGSPVASDEIGRAIKETNKTTIAVIRDTGASGGYWVASAADHVIANRMSITGSIGVTASYLEFSGLIQDYNVTYRRLVSGEYKDVGSPLRELEPEERGMFQDILDKLHDEFVEEVAENRNLPKDEVEEIADGMFFLGSRAKELGLVDQLGGRQEAKAYIRENLNMTADFREYKKEKTLADILMRSLSSQSFSIGKGIGAALTEDRSYLARI
ncbi:MAG: signal peptide peptidase SppA [Candidatus Woesearchaeota archaeon]